MDTIKTYLETMFSALPKTEEGFRLKNELLISMEEKYNELKAAGKSENEAVGTVISEFGNIEELTEEIGLAIEKAADDDTPIIELSTVQAFLEQLKSTSKLTAIGVFMILASVAFLLSFFVLSDIFNGNMRTNSFFVGLGFVVFAVLLAPAVGMLSYTWLKFLKYDFIYHKFRLSEHVRQYVQNVREKALSANITLIAVGVTVIVLSIITIIVPAVSGGGVNAIISGVSMFLVLTGIGTAPLILAGLSIAFVNLLLGLGESEWFPAVYVGSKGIKVGNEICIDNNGIRIGNDVHIEKNMNLDSIRIIGVISAVYWPLVVAAYLLWSFLSGAWGITWLIWPVAGLIFGAISGGLGAYYSLGGKKK